MSDNISGKKYRFTKPIDMPRSTHYGNNYWIFPSRKLGRRVTAFSNLEYYHLMTLEMDPQVIWYCEQPFEADVIDETDGKLRHVIFDAYALFRDEHEELREVKYSSDLEYHEPVPRKNLTEQVHERGEKLREKALHTQRQIHLESKWCADNNIPFRLMTEKEIISGRNYIQNLICLFSNMPASLKEDWLMAEQIRSFIRTRNCTTMRDLISASILDRKTWLAQIAPIYFSGDIGLKLKTDPLSYSTEVVEYGK